MEIILGVYTGEKSVLDKWAKVTSKTTFSGAVRGEINVFRPEIVIEAHITTFFNYAYIPDFGCYYYISEINDYRQSLSIPIMTRDPLQTFAAGIKASPAIAARASDNHVNADYPDSRYKTLQSNDTSIISIGNFGVSHEIILGFIE